MVRPRRGLRDSESPLGLSHILCRMLYYQGVGLLRSKIFFGSNGLMLRESEVSRAWPRMVTVVAIS